ncbi:MAG: DUF1559 domain-containing protein [Gemmataceae bacterium]|nr:DUF1559 domain-containing protein [Gemmataceae bacterium]
MRSAFTRADLLIVCVLLGLGAGFLMPALVHAQLVGGRNTSINNVKQICLAAHSYHDASNRLPSGNDQNNFSGLAHLLPYLEQQNVYNKINFKKPVDDKSNDEVRKITIKTFVSPLDLVKTVRENVGPTNYFLCAGSKPLLKDNDGVACQDSKLTLGAISNADGASNTLMIGESLKGDGGNKAADVKRQHVALDKDYAKNLNDNLGAQDWKDGKNVAGDRGSSWLDGRFLQSTYTATRVPNAPEPDVNIAGLGGLSSLRSTDGTVVLGFCDGSVRVLKKKIDLKVWKALATWNGGEVLPADQVP